MIKGVSYIKNLSLGFVLLSTVASSALASADGKDEDIRQSQNFGAFRNLFESPTPTNSPSKEQKPEHIRSANGAIAKLSSKLDGEAEVRAKKLVEAAEKKAEEEIKQIRANVDLERTKAQAELEEVRTRIATEKAALEQELQTLRVTIEQSKGELSTLGTRLATAEKKAEDATNDAIVTWSGLGKYSPFKLLTKAPQASASDDLKEKK